MSVAPLGLAALTVTCGGTSEAEGVLVDSAVVGEGIAMEEEGSSESVSSESPTDAVRDGIAEDDEGEADTVVIMGTM